MWWLAGFPRRGAMKYSARLVAVLALLAFAMVTALALFSPVESLAVDQPFAVVVDQASVDEITVVSMTVPKAAETPNLIPFDMIDSINAADLGSTVMTLATSDTPPPDLAMAVNYNTSTTRHDQSARLQLDALPLLL